MNFLKPSIKYQEDEKSLLYWESLGIKDYDNMKKFVTNTLDFLYSSISNAILSLNKPAYKYKFAIKTEFTLNTPKNLMNNDLTLYSDEACKIEFFKGRLKSSEKIIKEGFHAESKFYIKKSKIVIRAVDVAYVLDSIEPVELQDEEMEADAIDNLFNADKIYLEKIDKKGILRILAMKKNKHQVVVSKPEFSIDSKDLLMIEFNTYNLRRQCNALEFIAASPQKYMLPIINLLQKNRYSNYPQFSKKNVSEYHVLTDVSADGTAEQRDFTRIALGTPDFAILEGPPGSGKTSTLLEIILNLCMSGKRVMMVASTHVAVDNILERLIEKSSGNRNFMDEFGVIPLRIGNEDNVSEPVKEYIIKNRTENEKKRLLKALGELEFPTESQSYLLQALNNKDETDKIIERLVIKSSNFICGTTMGIMNSFIIMESDLLLGKPPFDYMIIDEASKTTFTEFLVPALYAEHWIISGDPKQLSPYVDQEFIKMLVSNLPSLNAIERQNSKNITRLIKDAALDVFNAANNPIQNKYRGALIIGLDKQDREDKEKIYEKQITKIIPMLEGESRDELRLYSLESANSSNEDKLMLLGSSLIIGEKNTVENMIIHIPPGLAIRGIPPDKLQSREDAVADMNSINMEQQSWEDGIVWRLNRAYEMRDTERAKKYLGEIDRLIPYGCDENDNKNNNDKEERNQDSNYGNGKILPSKKINDNLKKIRKNFFPSIIEVLQNGCGESIQSDEEKSIPLYDGLSPNVFLSRHVLLSYQHRMHPEISRYSRSNFYNNEALKDDHQMFKNREWGYKEYATRCVWIDKSMSNLSKQYPRTNRNDLEVRIIRGELEKFIKWASKNHNNGGNWKVSLISFYRGQEKELIKMMQDLSGKKNYRYFRMDNEGVDVEVCTVDRFQGQEADIVFLSMVRNRGVGFLDNSSRMNVAITRAKYQMVIVGNKKPFKRSGVNFLVNMAKEMEGPI